MKKKTINKIKDSINKRLDDIYSNDSITEENMAEVRLLTEEYKMITSIEDKEIDMKNKVNKSKADVEKVYNDIRINNDRLTHDSYDMDRNYRLKLEVTEFDQKIRNLDIEVSKKEKLVNIGIKMLEIGLPLAVNTALVLLNLKLIYADDGLSPSSLKDLMRNIK